MDPTSPEGAPSVEYLAEKMARAVVWKEKFIVGAIGSSVTAGHDNCAYDSYENQLERTMAKVWEAADVERERRRIEEAPMATAEAAETAAVPAMTGAAAIPLACVLLPMTVPGNSNDSVVDD